MSTTLVLIVILGFFAALFLISWFSSRGSNSETFFTGNRKSPWYLVAFGMIGATISGVTFISVPGEVGNSAWRYFQFILGNFVGYWVIALVLLPLYYRRNLVSIYTYLDQRFGLRAYKTGSFFFLLSQTIGASFRLYLVAGVLQISFFDALGIPFWVTVLTTITLIWLYTFKAGIKTVVWTDTLQTLFILLSVVVTIIVMLKHLDMDTGDLFSTIIHHPYSKIFDWNWQSGTNFFKQFLAGIGITIVMTGLDQNMMQKNLTCKNLKEAQKNLFWFSFSFVAANLLFLGLGVLLYHYAEQMGIALPERTDDLFPLLAIKYFGTAVGVFFLLGITAAAYSSADSSLTALTTAFCIDFLNVDPKQPSTEKKRIRVHLTFSFIMFLVIVLFRIINDESVVNSVFTAAGYTYGPLLGLFTFGILTKRKVRDRFVPFISVLSPIICYVVSSNSEEWFGGYRFGFELLLLNGLLVYLGLWAFSKKVD
ncbi:sodium:solute symporter [Thermophagus xiamenensis]|uniref:Transporter, SSS family n=1 Tax=Thermophagus xiamenensis TaxID=385682 RepID=A0A1I1Z8P5_9BACT|nr:sodium:solute symporter [Thermophagus xiamenensis]SFE26893.1 transporter, SSS family [Thermophagus xiamenensis]